MRPGTRCALVLGLLAAGCSDDVPAPGPGAWTASEGTLGLRRGALALAGVVPTLVVDGRDLTLGAAVDWDEVRGRASGDGPGTGEQVVLRGELEGLGLVLTVQPLGDSALAARLEVANAGSVSLELQGAIWAAEPVVTDAAPAGAVIHGYDTFSPTLFARVPHGSADLARTLLVGNDGDDLQVDPRVSWWMSLLALDDGSYVFSGALAADAWKTRVSTYLDPELRWTVIQGLTGTALQLDPGATIAFDWIVLALDDEPHRPLERWAEAAARLNPAPAAPFVPLAWSSWNGLFDAVTEEDVLANVAVAQRELGALALDTIEIDDGWERAWGDWTANEKFPTGMDGLARTLAAAGLRPGLWLAPFFVAPDTPVAHDHPDWLVRDAGGDPLVYVTDPGPQYALDPTHPDARGWIRDEVRRLLQQGYRYIKVDFLFAGAFDGQHHDPTMTPLQGYRATLALVAAEAEAAGAYVLACGAPILPTLGRAHALRTGTDVANRTLGHGFSLVRNAFRNIALRYALGRAIAADPDAPLVGGVTVEEARVALVAALLTGPTFTLGDELSALSVPELAVLQELPELPLLAALRSPGYRGARPLDLLGTPRVDGFTVFDLFLDPSDHVASLWPLPLADGTELLAVFAWGEGAESRCLDLAALGLPAYAEVVELVSGATLLARDGCVPVDQPAHSVRLLHLRP